LTQKRVCGELALTVFASIANVFMVALTHLRRIGRMMSRLGYLSVV